MDKEVTCSRQNCKTRKLCERQDRDFSGRDIISKLPDEVLVHILNFLPTKDAIRTSVLSSRWRFLWPLTVDIHFDDEMIYPDDDNRGRDVNMEHSLFDSVDNVFLQRGTLNLRKFHISFITPVPVSRVSWWVTCAVKLGVQDLSLSLPPKVPFVIPHCLFTSKSLHNLEIEMNSPLRIAKTICFPCLKTLSLSYVSFRDTVSAHRLLSGLPVLESLVLRGCRWGKGDMILIQIPSLRNLTIEYDSWMLNTGNCCVIMVYAANLVSFHCHSVLQFRICLWEVSSSLVNASLDLRSRDDNELGSLYAEEMLYAVREVEQLFLTNYTLLSLAPSEFHTPLIPEFKNLTHMEVEVAREASAKDYAICLAWKALLKRSRNLNSLRVDASLCPWEDWLWVKLPRCFTNSSLKIFKITNFKGNETDMKIFTLFLRNCSTLEQIEVEISPSVISNKLEIRRRVKETLDRIITDRVKKMNNIDCGTIEYPISYVNFPTQI